MDGRALTATELSLEGEVTPSTASHHLARLTAAGILSQMRQGRHRYFQLANPEIATVLESLLSLAPSPRASVRTGPADEGLRRSRVCYDHLAGALGVSLLERLLRRKLVAGDAKGLRLTKAGEAWALALRIDLGALKARRRPLCRPCLDWSERRIHLGGAVGAAVLDRLFALRYARRAIDSREVLFSPRGAAFLEDLKI